MLTGALLVSALPAFAQPPRENVIWARSTNGAPITLDGVLNEPAWAAAESKVIRFGRGVDNGIPGSGYQFEGGIVPKDSTYATIKLLVVGNQLYMGAVVRDSTIGGSDAFNRMDGLLMAIKDHASAGRPAPPAEYLYSWWYQPPLSIPDPKAPGLPPVFGGRWATPPWGSPRTPEQIAAWDAVTKVQGLTNSDAVVDTSYTVEMRFDLTPMGYDVTVPAGDIIEWNISIYDCDWFWPQTRFSGNRTWWQSPWGNAMWYDEVRIFSRPGVTITSGPVPVVGPEARVANAGGYPAPVIDGFLTEQVWSLAPSFDIRYGDDALRETYGNPLKWRAGQYQPAVNGGLASVDDPGDATVRWFFKEDTLFLGFDVRDQKVTSIPVVDRWDGFIVSINDRVVRWRDNNLESRRLAFRVGPDGLVKTEDWTDSLLALPNGGKIALRLKPGTTVDTTGSGSDTGYTAEFAINLTKLGYPPGRGDGALFIGIDYFDGDCYPDFLSSYGTRTWWGREYQGECCPVSAYMDPNLYITTGVGEPEPGAARFTLLGNSPNPFDESTTIHFRMAAPSRVTLEVYDVQGRLVSTRRLGVLPAGERSASVNRRGLDTGVYVYRLRMAEPGSGALQAELSGKMMLLR
jgi:hypothetical protein